MRDFEPVSQLTSSVLVLVVNPSLPPRNLSALVAWAKSRAQPLSYATSGVASAPHFAGAAVVGPSDFPGIGPTIWGSDGSQWETIRQTESWLDVRDQGLGHPTIGMAGQSVFRWAVWSMAPVARQAIEAAGITPDDLDAFIPHQANMRIIDAMLKQLKLPADIPVARDIAETANTSAASIPLATERMLREGEIPHGGLALQIGFGAGLVYAAQVIVLP